MANPTYTRWRARELGLSGDGEIPRLGGCRPLARSGALHTAVLWLKTRFSGPTPGHPPRQAKLEGEAYIIQPQRGDPVAVWRAPALGA